MHIRITFCVQTIINIFIQVISPNIITYLEITSKDEQNDIKFKKYLFRCENFPLFVYSNLLKLLLYLL